MYSSLYENGKIHTPFFNSEDTEVSKDFIVKRGQEQIEFEDRVRAAIEIAAIVDPEAKEPPQFMPTLQAVDWQDGKNNKDTRPRIYDEISKKYHLLDSGAMLSCVPATPEDKVRPDLALEAANGSVID